MEPISSVHKTIGIVIAALTILGVGGVTFVSERSAPSVASVTPNNSSPLPTATTHVTPATTAKAPATPIPVSTPVASTPPPATVPKQTAYVYKNGTYTATGSYNSPGGEDQITITVTLTNDVITNVSAVSGAGDRTSQRYQGYFLSGYKQYVVGQNIANVNLTYISGSSLTPIGFDNALSQIMAQAKA